jgi:rhodanese-related sulfurtransferase
MDLKELNSLLQQSEALLYTVVVDVRSQNERNKYHLQNTLHIPLQELLFSKEALARYEKIIFLCAHGHRAREASAAYESLGFTNVDYVDGNIEEWSSYGLPVVTCILN